VQRAGEPGDDAVLEREDVVHEAVDLLAAEVRAVARVEVVRRDAHARAELLERAPHHPLRPQRAPHLGRDLGVHRPAGERRLDPPPGGGVLPDHLDAGDLAEVRGHGLDDAGRQPVDVGGAREVRELEDEHARAGRLPPLGRAQPRVGAGRRARRGGRVLERLGERARGGEAVLGLLGERRRHASATPSGRSPRVAASGGGWLARCWRMIANAVGP
jgi:hypothetical protein